MNHDLIAFIFGGFFFSAMIVVLHYKYDFLPTMNNNMNNKK